MILTLIACCSLQTPTLPLCRQEITANQPLSPLARFGLGLAADGDWIAIGDPLTARGRAYLYEYDVVTDRHVYRATITPTDPSDFEFGWDIALDGDLLVIGSPSSLGAPVTNPGSVYAYRLVGGQWQLDARIEPSTPEANDRFGWAVDVSDGRIAASAPDRDFGFSSRVGAVFVFEDHGQGWVQDAMLVPSQPIGLVEDFGFDLALDGPTLAAPFFDDPVSSRVVVFRRDSATGAWVEEVRLPTFIGGVAVEGDRVVTASIDSFQSSISVIHTADRDPMSGSWTLDSLPPIDLDGAGRRLALKGGRLVIGASPATARRVRTYVEASGAWALEQEATPLGETPTSNFAFGERVAVSSDHVVVAASNYGLFDDGRVFRYTPGCDTFGDVTCFQPGPNSTLQGAELYAVGSVRVSDNDLVLVATQLPTNEMGMFLASRDTASPVVPPMSEGSVCLGGAIGRFAASSELRNSGPEGRFELRLDLQRIPMPTQDVAAMAGESWYFQAWFRDGTMSRTSNFTDAIRIDWE